MTHCNLNCIHPGIWLTFYFNPLHVWLLCLHSNFFLCGLHHCFWLFFFLQGANSVVDEEKSYGPVILRKKRAAGKEKNTCQLFIQTDHMFFKYYGTREAVIAQVHSRTVAWLEFRGSFASFCSTLIITSCSIIHLPRLCFLSQRVAQKILSWYIWTVCSY